MKKLAVVCAACLVLITLILARREWADYRRAREAEEALALSEWMRPPRYRAAPEHGGGAEQSAPARVVVAVDERGGMKIGGEDAGTLADLGPLRAKLARELGGRGEGMPGREVVIRAPRGLKYTEIVKLVGAAKQAGGRPGGLELYP